MEQLTLFNENTSTDNAQTTNISNKDNLFSCCHRIRECSDAKKCLMSDNPDFINCIYRKNLENGKVFIGKNSNGFDINTYNHFINIYISLNDNEKYELNCILIYYQKFRSSFIWYNSPEIEKLSNLGFIQLSKDNSILEKCSMSFLRSLTSKKFSRKDDLINYLKANEPTIIDEFINKFRIIRFSYDTSRYMFELYHDYLPNKDNQYKKSLPFENTQIFMKGCIL